MMKPIVISTLYKRQNPKKTEQNEIKFEQPIIPIAKISHNVISKLQNKQIPSLIIPNYSSVEEASEIYYKQYLKMYEENKILNDNLIEILTQRNQLAQRYNEIKKEKSYDENIRRRRRFASEIQRNFYCPISKCHKGYGTQGSLAHHVRLKHQSFFQNGQYELYIENLMLKGESRSIKQQNTPQKEQSLDQSKEEKNQNKKSKN